MKLSLHLFLLLCFFGTSTLAQITLQSSDLPFNTDSNHVVSLRNNLPVKPNVGTSQVWDYQNYNGTYKDTWAYSKEELEFFTNAGVDGYIRATKGFNANFFWEYDIEYDFNENGIYDIGMYIPEQRYGLGQISGNVNDSLIIPLQGYLFGTPRVMMTFPSTHTSSWRSTGRRYMDFTLRVPAFGLNNTPARHAYTWVRQDTIVGYGKMRVYTPDGPSKAYDVLMHRTANYTLDSFYLNGQPAPIAVLAAFGVSQGQKTDQFYFYNFYRKEAPGYVYLARATYSDANFSVLKDFWVNTDQLTTSSTEDKETYSSLLFPNPALPGQTITIISDRFETSLVDYNIFNLSGQGIQSGKLAGLNKQNFTLNLENVRSPGVYQIIIQDQNGNTLTEEFILQSGDR